MANDILDPNNTLQQKLVNFVTARLQETAASLQKDIVYKSGYILEKTGSNFELKRPENGKKFQLENVEFVPIMFTDFAGSVVPIADKTETGTINITAILSDNEGKTNNTIADNLEVLEVFAQQLVGVKAQIDEYTVGFNISTINQDTSPEIFAGKNRCFISFSVYYVASSGVMIGNGVFVELDGEKLETLGISTSRSFIPLEEQLISETSSKSLFKDNTWQEDLSLLLPNDSAITNKIIMEIEDPTSSNVTFAYKKVFNEELTFIKKVGIQGGNITSKPGAFITVTVILKEAK